MRVVKIGGDRGLILFFLRRQATESVASMKPAEIYNHRLVKFLDDSGTIMFAVHEIHYDEDKNIVGWNPKPIPILADSLEQIKLLGEQVIRATELPVLYVQDNGDLA